MHSLTQSMSSSSYGSSSLLPIVRPVSSSADHGAWGRVVRQPAVCLALAGIGIICLLLWVRGHLYIPNLSLCLCVFSSEMLKAIFGLGSIVLFCTT